MPDQERRAMQGDATDRILAQHGEAIARQYRVWELDLSQARDNEEIPFKGNFIGLMYISALGSPVRVRLDTEEADSIPFYTAGGVTIAYDKFYLSNAAMPGVVGVVMAGWDLR